MKFPLSMNPHHFGRVKFVNGTSDGTVKYKIFDGKQPIETHKKIILIVYILKVF